MKDKILLELRAAVGGDDSKLLIGDMKDIYLKTCRNNSLEFKIVEENDALIVI
jgi:protein subunit release factor A